MKRVLFCFALALPVFSYAQDQSSTLADVRQDLNVLYVEIQKLKRELSTTSGPSLNLAQGSSVLERVGAIEQELQRLTAQTEELQYRVDHIVKDGTNRIGDLEFRLVELEGGDISSLAETTTLGGNTNIIPTSAQNTGPELAIGERADFDAARQALDDKNFEMAANLFERFSKTYPDSPLIANAMLLRGYAFDGVGDTQSAARAYLDSFSNYPNADVAPQSLLRLGQSLVDLGQADAGCQTLSQVEIRFPDASEVQDAAGAMQAAMCQ